MSTECELCGLVVSEGVRHLPLYVRGSEGVRVCISCQVALTEFARALSGAANRAKRQTATEAKPRSGGEG